MAYEKKLEHTMPPGQRKEDRPKHLSTIDHIRSITHFTFLTKKGDIVLEEGESDADSRDAPATGNPGSSISVE